MNDRQWTIAFNAKCRQLGIHPGTLDRIEAAECRLAGEEPASAASRMCQLARHPQPPRPLGWLANLDRLTAAIAR